MAWVVLSTSLRQTLVPPRLLGRVNAAYRTLGRGASPLGALAGGLLVAGTEIRAPFLLGAPLLLGAALLSCRSVNSRALAQARTSQEVCP